MDIIQKWLGLVGLGGAGVGAVVLIALAVLQTLPADSLVREVVGVDRYEYHTPLFGKRGIEQSFTADSPTLSRIDVLIVDMKRTGISAPLLFELRESGLREVLREVKVAGSVVRDDYYVPFSFEPLENTAGRTFTITVAAPEASLDAPYAVRLTEDKQGIAWRYWESTTQLAHVRQWLTEHHRAVTVFHGTLLMAVLAAWLIPYAAGDDTRYPMVVLGLTLLLGSWLQLRVAGQLVGDPGGDAYYYLVAAHQIAHGQNPLAEWSFRLPLYSTLLMPAALPSVPDLWWGRLLGILTTVGLGGVLMMLARSLRLRPIVGIVALMLLYLSSDFVVTSVRPRPHTLHTLLLLLSVALLWRVRTIRQALGWGIVLGLAGMTRQEAYVPIGMLGLVFLGRLIARRWPLNDIIKHVAAVAIPFLVIISPYLWANYRQFGNPFDSPYFHKSDTPQAHSLTQFIHHNGTITAQKLSHAWLAADKPNVRSNWPRLLTSILATLAIVYYLRQWWERPSRPVVEGLSLLVAAGLIILIYQWLFASGNDWNQQLNIALLATIVIGGVELVRAGRWRTAVLLVVVLTQIVLATWYNPIARLFQAVYPVSALASAALLLSLAGISIHDMGKGGAMNPWRHSARLLPLVLAVAFLGIVSIKHFANAIDEVNFPAAPYHVSTAAAERLERYPLVVAAAEVEYTEGDGMYRLHSYQQRSLLRFPEVVMSSTEQWQWLCERGVRYVIDNDDLVYLTVHEDPAYASSFKLRFEEKAFGRNSRLFRTRTFELTCSELEEQL